jgi:hypothetical protein
MLKEHSKTGHKYVWFSNVRYSEVHCIPVISDLPQIAVQPKYLEIGVGFLGSWATNS